MADEQTTTTTTRRGRPRPTGTIQRDEQVYDALEGERTKMELVSVTGLAANEVYLSLYRLQRDGRVLRRRGERGHVWTRQHVTVS